MHYVLSGYVFPTNFPDNLDFLIMHRSRSNILATLNGKLVLLISLWPLGTPSVVFYLSMQKEGREVELFLILLLCFNYVERSKEFCFSWSLGWNLNNDDQVQRYLGGGTGSYEWGKEQCYWSYSRDFIPASSKQIIK